MSELLYDIWLSLLFPFGSEKPCQILTQFSSARAFYESDREEWEVTGLFTKSDLKRIKHIPLKQAEEILRKCEAKRIHAISIRSKEYPESLRSVYGPPVVLYYYGKLDVLQNCVPITVVGTRKANPYCVKMTRLICKSMARAGAVIVSGFAMGIDEAAHLGALDGKGKTVAVLACGVDVNYPREHYELKRQILQSGGLILSEIPPGLPMNGSYFPTRNRLLAGLGLGVFVPQAPMKSGASITVEHALEQGKDIFCLPPYNVTDSACMGVMRFIRDGCSVVANAEDILMGYYFKYPGLLKPAELLRDSVPLRKEDQRVRTEEDEPENKPEPKKPTAELPKGLSEKLQTLYSKLPSGNFDLVTLSKNPELASPDTLSGLLELELYGLLQKTPDGQYQKL